MIDLRSDTITQPTQKMRQVMAEAVVGDDVLGDDPSVRALEDYTADLLGKEAAVFMPSGTMTNQVALRVHTEPGDEIILEAEAHIYYYEGGGPAALSGAMCRLVPGKQGIITAAQIEKVFRPVDPHFARTRLVCLENTHNRGGGKIFPLDEIERIAALCQDRGLMLHLDGARFWNACVATGVSPRDYAKPFDTVSVCFSKGLGAPVGSALVGTMEQMQRARRFRKLFGGGMRQAGIIAAGALYALQHQLERLAEDHGNARRLAENLAAVDGVEIVPASVETNLVVFGVPGRSAVAVADALKQQGVAMLAVGAERLRAVTSLMVDEPDIAQVAGRLGAVLSQL